MPWLFLTALLAVYIILGMLYESLIHPLTILSTIPSAGLGALLALVVDQQRSRYRLGDWNHFADRHCEEKRDHDGRFRARSVNVTKA